jgi:hypothetical protein
MITVIGQLTDQLLEMKDRRLSLVDNIANLRVPMASLWIGETLISSPDPTRILPSMKRYGSKSSISIRDYFIEMGKSISIGDERMGNQDSVSAECSVIIIK